MTLHIQGVHRLLGTLALGTCLACGGRTPLQGLVLASRDGSMDALTDGSVDDSGVDAAVDTGLPCDLSAASFDQSCAADSDCIAVASRDYCTPGCLCGNSAINLEASAQFNALAARTPLGSGALGNTSCPCAVFNGPCCRGGSCSIHCP